MEQHLCILEKSHNSILILVILFLFTINLHAQYPTIRPKIENLPTFDNKVLHYGYFVGFNDFGFKFEYADGYYANEKLPDIQVEKSLGFNVGLIGDLRINKFFNLRIEPGLYANQKKLIYPDQLNLKDDQEKIREVKSTYIHIPLLIKFSSVRVNNFKPYIVAGLSTSFNLSSNQKSNDDNQNNVFRVKSKTFNYETGFGIDFYLPYFKFSPSIRGIFSINNELIQDNDIKSPWTSNINRLFSRAVVINFTFE